MKLKYWFFFWNAYSNNKFEMFYLTIFNMQRNKLWKFKSMQYARSMIKFGQLKLKEVFTLKKFTLVNRYISK